MNEIKIANILVNKRREKGITQEELARIMGVSKAAVSKWEKEQSYPDILLLPKLAMYFNISIDELLGYSPQLSSEDIWKICNKLSAHFITKNFNEFIEECRGLVNKYYSCFPFLFQVALLLINHKALAKTEDNQKEVLNEAKVLCGRIVSESANTLLAKDALHVRCFCSIMLKEPDEVLTLLGESIHTSGITEDHLISEAYKLMDNTVKAIEVTQCGIYTHLMSLVESMLNYVSLVENSFDVVEIAYNRVMELIRLYNVENLNSNLTAKAYLIGANLYCKYGNCNNAIELIEKYADLCFSTFLPFELKGDAFFTDINTWLESGVGITIPYDEQVIKQSMLNSLNIFTSFNILQHEPRYKKIIKKLTDFVNTK